MTNVMHAPLAKLFSESVQAMLRYKGVWCDKTIQTYKEKSIYLMYTFRHKHTSTMARTCSLM